MPQKLTIVLLALVVTSANAQYTADILPTPTGRGIASGAGGGQIVGDALSGLGGWPCMWDVSKREFVSLLPTGYDYAQAFGAGGGRQVGHGFVNNDTRALVWSGSASSAIDLHPQGYLGSIAYGADGPTQVGAAAPVINESHAALWSGSSQTMIDLHPGGQYGWSEAYDVQGGVQVGVAENVPVIWRGSAASMQLLPMPKGSTLGNVNGIHGAQVVGAISGFAAVVWDVDKWTYTLLGGGIAHDTNGVHQVGIRGTQAIRWSGSKGTDLNLHQFLPSNIVESTATGIDESGTIVGWGTITGLGQVPIVWTPVPEPSSLFALALGIGALAMRRRRKRQAGSDDR